MESYKCLKCSLIFGSPTDRPNCPKCGSRKIVKSFKSAFESGSYQYFKLEAK